MTTTPVVDRTVAAVLDKRAETHPDKLALLDESGKSFTYRELRDASLRIGSGLREAGVGRQEPVVILLDNHVDLVTVWAGAGMTSIIAVPINTAYKGEMLQYVINKSKARIAVVEAGYCERLAEVIDGLTELQIVYVRGEGGELPTRLERRDFADLGATESIVVDRPRVSDICNVIFTSGTEGPSKAVLCPHGHAFQTSASFTFQTDETDVVLVVLPLFHAGGLFTGVLNALRGGATAVIRSFSVGRFWDDVREYGCTQTVLMGAMIDFLWRAPASDSDRAHPLRNVTVVPAMPYVREFADRFGISVESAYGQSETGTPIIASAQDAEPFLCGTPRSFFEIRIVDDNDVEVPVGAPGEILVRSNEPWSMFAGYLDDMAATIKATRNGWVHTGDMGRRNERGQIFFVDRKKDALRRRGENISSLEVEKYLLAHPGVAEAAIVSVPSEHLEDDIKAVVVLEAGSEFNPEHLLRDLYERLPYFMVPRYYEVIDELPLTPTKKVAKAELRKRGVTATTWDCEAHGFTVTRSALREEVRSS